MLQWACENKLRRKDERKRETFLSDTYFLSTKSLLWFENWIILLPFLIRFCFIFEASNWCDHHVNSLLNVFLFLIGFVIQDSHDKKFNGLYQNIWITFFYRATAKINGHDKKWACVLKYALSQSRISGRIWKAVYRVNTQLQDFVVRLIIICRIFNLLLSSYCSEYI